MEINYIDRFGSKIIFDSWIDPSTSSLFQITNLIHSAVPVIFESSVIVITKLIYFKFDNLSSLFVKCAVVLLSNIIFSTIGFGDFQYEPCLYASFSFQTPLLPQFPHPYSSFSNSNVLSLL